MSGKEPAALKLAGAAHRPFETLLRSCLPWFLLLGSYLTLRGYHSFDGDQAYRLPILLHQQDHDLFANDPFVRSFDTFNPHRGSLALLAAVARPLGLAAGLFLVFILTFLATGRAIFRLARATWPELGPSVGWVAVALFLSAKAGNIGTNHLFEAMVLDRLVALALGWCAIADAVIRPANGSWRSAIGIAAATVIHPSVGLQLAMVLGTSWIAWTLAGRSSLATPGTALRGTTSLILAVIPGLAVNLPQGTTLRGDLPEPLFWILSIELQSPQHMLPHLWRMPQWLAWSSYLAVAIVQLAPAVCRRTHGAIVQTPSDRPSPDATAPRLRLAIMLAVIAVGLAAAWYAIEVRHAIQATVFQPFRMSTVIRGICLVLISGRVLTLWRSGSRLDRTRAIVLTTGFLGDWRLVVATVAELAVSATASVRRLVGDALVPRVAPALVYLAVIALGLNFLAHHDTESGHLPLLIALGAGMVTSRNRMGALASRLRAGTDAWRTRRLAAVVGIAWIVPCMAMLAEMIPPDHAAARLPIVRALVDRCRIVPMPQDDIERLALWCRANTPPASRFIGPPGPKTFRLWSRRNLAFSRAGSPYHGEDLADWFVRFQDHVGFRGTPEEFVKAYRDHRHEFEARYDTLSDRQLAALAVRQEAQYVIAPAHRESSRQPSAGPLELLHVEGRYAAYRVIPSALVHRQP